MKYLNTYCRKLILIIFFVGFFGFGVDVGRAIAADYYVSQNGAGNKSGISPDNSWQGFSAVNWDTDGEGPDEGVGGGDTLYIMGTIRANTFIINGYGLSQEQYMKITSYLDDPGKIWQGLEITGDGWFGPDEFGVYSKPVNYPTTYSVASEWISDPWTDSVRLNTMSGAPDSSWNESVGLYYGDNVNDVAYYKPTSGTPEGKTLTAWASTSRVFNVTDKDYVAISNLKINNEIKFYDSTDYLILENNEIFCSGIQGAIIIGSFPGYTPSNHGIIRSNYMHDCGNGIYFINQGYGNEYNNDYWVVEDNYLENIHGTSDSHGIGVQGGTGNIFQRNHIYNAGSGITFWNDTDQIMRDNIVRFNKINHLGYYHESDQANGRGIEFSGETADSDLTRGNLIYGNVVSDCYRDSDGDPDGVGIRIKNGILESGGYSIKTFNNIVSDCHYSYYLLASNYENYEVGAYFRNNISLNPKTGGYHVFVSTIGAVFDLDFQKNLYYPDGKFYYDGTDCGNFEEWKASSNEDSSSVINNPNLDPLLIFQGYGSGIDGGEDMSSLSSSYLLHPSSSWPARAALESGIISPFIYGTPDIGAYEYQPPHTIGTDKIDITAGARIYGDGKFRDLEQTSSVLADLAITPESGFPTYSDDEVRPNWLDITAPDGEEQIIWTANQKKWQEISETLSTTHTLHIVGDLAPNSKHTLKIDDLPATSNITSDSCTNGLCTASNEGKITFTYTGGYSSHTFELVAITIRSDVDNSSVTNTTDALLTLRNSLGLSMTATAWQSSATTGDVNCDGISNSTDALLILRYSLGLAMESTAWCE